MSRLFFGLPVIAWAVVVWAAPERDFRLADDWAFAKGAADFAATGQIHYFHWAAMPCLGQYFAAAPWVWAFGSSPSALRCFAVLCLLVTQAALYSLLRACRRERWSAAFASAVSVCSPVPFILSATFMTDLPAFAFACAGLALYQRGLRGTGWLLAGGAVAATLAATTRQSYCALPVAMVFAITYDATTRRRLSAWLAALVPLAAGVAVAAWFFVRPDKGPFMFSLPAPRLALVESVGAILFCGFIALPTLAIKPWTEAAWKRFAVAAAVLGAYMAGIYNYRIHWFYGPYPVITGVFTWPEARPFGYEIFPPVAAGEPLWLSLTVCAVAGGAALFAHRPNVPPLVWAFTLLSLPLVLYIPTRPFDRYLLPLLPFAALAMTGDTQPLPAKRWLASAYLAAMVALSTCLVRDWLVTSAVREDLATRALRLAGGCAELVDADIPWNGSHWRKYPPDGEIRPAYFVGWALMAGQGPQIESVTCPLWLGGAKSLYLSGRKLALLHHPLTSFIAP